MYIAVELRQVVCLYKNPINFKDVNDVGPIKRTKEEAWAAVLGTFSSRHTVICKVSPQFSVEKIVTDNDQTLLFC